MGVQVRFPQAFVGGRGCLFVQVGFCIWQLRWLVAAAAGGSGGSDTAAAAAMAWLQARIYGRAPRCQIQLHPHFRRC